MHLLCTLAWSLILLPLGFCCKSQKSKEEITKDYLYVIQEHMETILNKIVNEMNGTCKQTIRSGNTTELQNVSTAHILNRVCKHSPTKFCPMSSEVKKLTKLVHTSLGPGCSCKEKEQHSTKKKQQARSPCPQSRLPRKKLCILKHWLEKIKDLYSQFNST
ncbi:hypothetical protein AALO_G00215830 [Alosa alosa]|uniref:Interleukin-7 n=1 Tax=Alosa alosa TaxID=278164 RepID=A0AAV6G5R4_9TELE|nr:hypothetical protein AALO_G00215830 [Alosa alosa]